MHAVEYAKSKRNRSVQQVWYQSKLVDCVLFNGHRRANTAEPQQRHVINMIYYQSYTCILLVADRRGRQIGESTRAYLPASHHQQRAAGRRWHVIFISITYRQPRPVGHKQYVDGHLLHPPARHDTVTHWPVTDHWPRGAQLPTIASNNIRTPFGHIWALIWSRVRGNITRTAL